DFPVKCGTNIQLVVRVEQTRTFPREGHHRGKRSYTHFKWLEGRWISPSMDLEQIIQQIETVEAQALKEDCSWMSFAVGDLKKRYNIRTKNHDPHANLN
ncbi:unnamed protein product, partial [Darwinula stevensoni]